MSVVTVLIMTNCHAGVFHTFPYLLNRGQSVVFGKLSTRNNAVITTIYDKTTRCIYIKLLHVSTFKLIIRQKRVKGHC
jgi:hypothetical protein